jgi:predicted dehydrogenase
LKKWPSAKKFYDFRDMFDKMGKEIDAVTVSTPDHTHAIAAAHAIVRKIQASTSKNRSTHDIWEARYLRTLARKYKVATQMGNQGSAANGLRRGVEAIQAGVIGQVTRSSRLDQPPGLAPIARDQGASHRVHAHSGQSSTGMQFIGTAPMRPYHKAYHPFNWRGWWDYGTGAIGDMTCHTANLAFHALKLTIPTLVVAQNEPLNPETFPGWATVVYHFPARGIPASRQIHLVRRQTTQRREEPAAEGPLPRSGTSRLGLPPGRRKGHHVLAQRLRRPMGPPAREEFRGLAGSRPDPSAQRPRRRRHEGRVGQAAIKGGPAGLLQLRVRLLT